MKYTLILFVALSTWCTSVRAVLIDFNTAGDLDNNFNSTGTGSGIGKWSEQSGNGIGESDSVTVGTAGNQGTEVYNVAFDGSAAALSVSMMFEFDPVTPENTGGAGLFLGFGSSSTWDGQFGSPGGADDNQFMVALTGNGASTKRLIHYNTADGTTTPDNPGAGANFSVTAGNWYQLKLDVTNNFDNTYDIISSIYNVNGTTGEIGSLVQSKSTLGFTNADFAAGADAYAFFGGQAASDNRVGVNYDNFEVIPEPSSIMLIGLALGSLALFRRKLG